MPFMNIHFLTLLPLLLLTTEVASDAPATLDSVDGFAGQRDCVYRCFGWQNIGSPLDNIASKISCPTRPVMNDCLCRPDLQRQANIAISTCVAKSCTSNQLDIQTATSLYDNYCTSNGYLKAAVAAPTGVKSGFSTITAAATLSDSPYQTLTNSANPSSEDPPKANGEPSKGSKLSMAEMIGIIVGTVSAVAAVITVWLMCRR